ncbi:hypothetical protein [Pseudorhodoplanes sp.]|uniref:hypothetical protein n=1 Tax=Pseudorhodoplanes sp. TaxID=1934341 RepID=UPI00391D581A
MIAIVKGFASIIPLVGRGLGMLFGFRTQTLKIVGIVGALLISGIVIDRHATLKERTRWEVKAYETRIRALTIDLNAEKAARANDLKTIDDLERQKANAEKANDALKDYIDTLPKGDQCIATPGRLRQLHKAR